MRNIKYRIIIIFFFTVLTGIFLCRDTVAQEKASKVRAIKDGESSLPPGFDDSDEDIMGHIWNERIKSGPASFFDPGLYSFTNTSDYKAIPHDGMKRYFKIHLPVHYSKDLRWPVVLVFHGGGGNADSAAFITQMNAKADMEGFIVVYPEGTGPYEHNLLTWNTWDCCGPAQKRNINDVSFIRELLFILYRKYSINPRRIYATGFSNGARLVYKSACELSDIIAAFAPVSGTMNGECLPQRAIPMIVIHGMADDRIPYYGGIGKKSLKRRSDSSVADSVNYFTYYNNCLSTPNRRKVGNVIHDTFFGCQNGGDIELYSIVNQGHAWPGGKKARRIGADSPSQEISATDLIWEFFKHHPFY